MLQPKKFRYTLIIRDEEYELDNAPDGWIDTKVEYKRSESYNGLVRALTLPTKFELKGAYLLRSEHYTYFIKADVNIRIEQLDPATRKYITRFYGQIDFSTAKDEQNSFTVNATEVDISIAIKAYEDVEYAIPLNVPEAIDIELTPLVLKEQASLIIVNRNNPQADTFPGLKVVNNDQNSVTNSVQNVESKFQTDPTFAESDIWFYRAIVDTKVQFKVRLLIALQPTNNARYAIEIHKNTGELVKLLYEYIAGSVIPPLVFIDIDTQFVIDMNDGEYLSLYFDSSKDGQANQGFLINGTTSGTFDLTYNVNSESSRCKGLRPKYIFDKLVENMNGSAYPTQSSLLTNAFKNLAYTCSDSIRIQDTIGDVYQAGDDLQVGGTYSVSYGSVTYNGTVYTAGQTFKYVLGQENFTSNNDGFVEQIAKEPQMIISFKKFFKDFFGLMCGDVAFGTFEGKAYLETRGFTFRDIPALNVGNISAPTFETATDILINTIKVGYADQQYDRINATSEINSTQYYSTPVTEPKNELDAVCDSRADPYGIEQIRINPVDTAASRSDNDNFIIWLEDTPVEGVYKPLLAGSLFSYSGMQSDYYNFFISPKQNLLRGGRLLKSLLYKMDGYPIKFESGLKNTNAFTIDQNGRRVGEGNDVPISNLPAPYFIPYYATFSPGLDYNALDSVDMNPYGTVNFNFNGNKFAIFADEISIDIGRNSTQEFKGLLSPKNDVLKLIR